MIKIVSFFLKREKKTYTRCIDEHHHHREIHTRNKHFYLLKERTHLRLFGYFLRIVDYIQSEEQILKDTLKVIPGFTFAHYIPFF